MRRSWVLVLLFVQLLNTLCFAFTAACFYTHARHIELLESERYLIEVEAIKAEEEKLFEELPLPKPIPNGQQI